MGVQWRPAASLEHHLAQLEANGHDGVSLLTPSPSPDMEEFTFGSPAMEPTMDEVGWMTVLLVCCVAILVIIAIVITTVYIISYRQRQKKKHNFGIKKFKSSERTFLNFRKSSPVANPDKGSHYLKKSPSPTGIKSPPGCCLEPNNETSLSPCDEIINGRPLISPSPQLPRKDNEVDGNPELSYSENEDGPRLGKLFFTIKYSFEKTALVVTVNKCTNLPAKDTANNTSDPYVKLQLLPEKQHKVKTRVLRRTLNPVYDVNFNQLPILTLHFVVLSFDRYSRDDVIGEVMLDLEALDLSNSDNNPLPISREITPRSYKLKSQGRGELLVSVCYQPAANRITVVVLKARNLPKMDITGLSDPYVKIYLLYNDQRIAKKKTHVKKRTLNPVFNESFVFELPHLDEGLKNISLEFMLLDWDRVTKNEVIGRLELGGDKCQGTALHHWNEVLASPRRQIAEWHKLRE